MQYKVMGGSNDGNIIVNYGKGPKRVQTNTVKCSVCKSWIHKRYNGIRGKLSLAVYCFRCKRCDGISHLSHWILHRWS